MSWDNAVGIATEYELNDRGIGVLSPDKARILTSAPRPERLRGPPILLSNGSRRVIPRG